MADMEPDRISCLPDHIIDQILSRLPIKEAGRTSVLSSIWRNKWSTQPDLVFDKQCAPAATSTNHKVTKIKFLRIIDQVLLLHSGPINKVKISGSVYGIIDTNNVPDIDRWILHLTKRSIKKLIVDFQYRELYKIPWCLFSCQSLQRLKLRHCWLKPPTTFEGFRNLKSLKLEQVTMTQDDFENLISGSPLLEKLILSIFVGFTQINIHSPNLKFVDINGKFEGISFDNTPQLAKVFVNQACPSRLHECSSNLVDFFEHLPNIEVLIIHSYFIKTLLAGFDPVKLPTPCINLTSLSICINFNDLKEISAALCLLKSSPNLEIFGLFERLQEHAGLITPVSYCWEDIFSDPIMSFKLKRVTIEDISGTKSEFDFIRFILLYSPVLEKMTVKPFVNFTSELMTKLIRFKRVSAQAEVIYLAKDYS